VELNSRNFQLVKMGLLCPAITNKRIKKDMPKGVYIRTKAITRKLPFLVVQDYIEVTTNKGIVFLISLEDINIPLERSWSISSQGYVEAKIKGKAILLHRLIAEKMGIDTTNDIDHINGNKVDCRRCNLRSASRCQNSWNSIKGKSNTSGYKGVSFDKRKNKWSAYITTNRKRKFLGYFNTPELAYQAYCDAAKKYHGDFANFG
jgi:AP2 domain/HNH endonuclease